MDTQAIRAQMPTLVSGHVPSNVRSFKFNIFDGQPKVSTLGFHIDPKAFEGKVIATTDEAIVVKTGRAEFAVLDRALVTEVPDEGAKVQVEPYARRRFDGQRADTPEEQTEFTADGQPYTVQRFVLGSAPAKLPIPEPRCPELQELIQQLEQLPAPDGFRRITHLLVDAGARDFTWVDPLPKDIIATPPAIGFTVATAKFQGCVTVLYERGLDLYAVELHRDGELVERVDEVFFDTLGETLERLIDDGSWRRIRVQCLSGSQGCPALTSQQLPASRREASLPASLEITPMTVRFKGTELRPVLAEAVANQCRVILVKDQGVYFLAERGERRPDGRQKTIAYAAGCNPDVDAFDDWWELARAEFGGDDFGEFFDPQEGVFACILHSEDDLDVSATATHLSLQAVPSAPSGN
jgi:hypothetical protein